MKVRKQQNPANNQRDIRIDEINNWARQYPEFVFSDEFKAQRQYLTDDTWREVIKRNPDIKVGDAKYNMLPTKFRAQIQGASVRSAIDTKAAPIAAGIFATGALPFAVEALASSAAANGIRTGLQATNTLFTPSTWLNPVTGSKLLSPTLGAVADAGVQGYFTYEGLNGLKDQASKGTLLSDPGNTIMNGLQVLPLVAPAAKVVGDIAQQGVGPYIFQHIPYRQMDKIPRFFRRTAEFLRTPLDENPFKTSFDRKRGKAMERPIKVQSDNNYKTYTGQDMDFFKKRLDHYDNKGPDIFNMNKVYISDVVDNIPVMNYVPLELVRDIVNERFAQANKFEKAFFTLAAYLRINSGIGVAVQYDKRPFVYINPKAMRDYNFKTDTTLPHEIAHILSRYHGNLPYYYNTPGFYSDILPKRINNYLRDDELWARGTQLKNYFGITDDTPITADMLKYAAQHYVEDTGMDNNMLQFFHTINDWDKAADQLSRYSYKSGGKIKTKRNETSKEILDKR